MQVPEDPIQPSVTPLPVPPPTSDVDLLRQQVADLLKRVDEQDKVVSGLLKRVDEQEKIISGLVQDAPKHEVNVDPVFV